MLTVYLIMGLGAMVAIPLVSLYLFLMGLGSLINAVARYEPEDGEDG